MPRRSYRWRPPLKTGAGHQSKATTTARNGKGDNTRLLRQRAVAMPAAQLELTWSAPAARATDPETSHQAAEGDETVRRFRRGVAVSALAEIRAAGIAGLTVDELHGRHLEADRGTLARRVTDLRQAGLVVDSGRRRLTRRGLPAIVWTATTQGVRP